jgi:hypothetical protein
MDPMGASPPSARPRRAPGLACLARATFLGALVAAVSIVVAAPPAAAKGGPPRPPQRPPVREEPVGAPIRDVPTTVSVPIDAETSLVLGLPERFWVQAPRINTVPTSLDGDGVIVQYINQRGGSVSMLYAGVVPLSVGDGSREQRASDTALDFAAVLADKYQRVDWSIFSGPVAVAPVTLKVDGVKMAAWRSKRYSTRPAAAYGGPTSVFTGELLLFHPPGSDRLAYVALDFKGGGTTLDKAIERLSLRKTHEVNPKGRRVQLLDLKESANDPTRFPVRLVAFDMPAGFVVTPDVLRLTGEWVYVEDRLDATGKRDAVLRIHQRPADTSKPPTQDRDDERAFYREEERGPASEVPLAVKGATAWLFEHPSPRDGAGARAMTAVLRLDDMTLLLTWTTFGDAAALARDRATFTALLGSLEHTVRW